MAALVAIMITIAISTADINGLKNIKKSKITNAKNDFDILSVQRNLKILGIFVRLKIRDKKSNYLKYIPYTIKLIKLRLKNPIFKKLETELNL